MKWSPWESVPTFIWLAAFIWSWWTNDAWHPERRNSIAVRIETGKAESLTCKRTRGIKFHLGVEERAITFGPPALYLFVCDGDAYLNDSLIPADMYYSAELRGMTQMRGAQDRTYCSVMVCD